MRKFIIAGIFTLLTLAINAQSEKEFTGSLLWKVSGKDVTKPSYILGTHHFADIAFLEKVNGFQKAFDASNIIIGELDLKDKAQLMQQVQQAMMISEGEKGYKELLSEEDFAKLEADVLKNLGMPLAPFIGMKPTLISTLLAAKIYSDSKPGFNPMTHKSIDEHVQLLATEKGKSVKGLEGVDDQLKALFSDPIVDQLNDLICTLNEVELGAENTVKLEKLYESADLQGLYDLAFNEAESKSACPMKEEKKNSILDNRNNHWLKQLPKLLKDDSTFIAVGALHLGGKEGLLYQLSKMGYTVEAVR